jgi:GGDEF domain-containing protein
MNQLRLLLVTAVSGLFFLLYFLYIVFLSIRTIRPHLLNGMLVAWQETPFLIAAGILLLGLFVAYANFFTSQASHESRINLKEIVFFVLYSLLLFCLLSLSLVIAFDIERFPLTKLVIVTLLYFLSLYPLLQIGNFLLRLFLFNFFIDRSKSQTGRERHVYRLLEADDFLVHAENTLNQCRRLKIGFGLLCLRIRNVKDIERTYGPRGSSFLRKQFIFLLSENARNYEPWGRSAEKDTFLNVLQVRDAEELKLAELRFKDLLEKHVFTIFDKDIKPSIVFSSLFLETSVFHSSLEESDADQLKRHIKHVTDSAQQEK